MVASEAHERPIRLAVLEVQARFCSYILKEFEKSLSAVDEFSVRIRYKQVRQLIDACRDIGDYVGDLTWSTEEIATEDAKAALSEKRIREQ